MTRPKFPPYYHTFHSNSLFNRICKSSFKSKFTVICFVHPRMIEVPMAFQQMPYSKSSGETSLSNNTKLVENSTGFCECNICLESAKDPVVTLCGHLYCWPCIYKWLHDKTDKQSHCPVCKAHISNSSLIPLYGRGNSPPSNEPESELKQAHQSELIIPNRPSPPGDSVMHLNQLVPFGSYLFGPSSTGGPMTATCFSNPIVEMVGEMVCGTIFRSSDSGYFTAYPYGSYQNPYLNQRASDPRVRRQVMQVEKSLNRLTFFLFFCFILCLLLF